MASDKALSESFPANTITDSQAVTEGTVGKNFVRQDLRSVSEHVMMSSSRTPI